MKKNLLSLCLSLIFCTVTSLQAETLSVSGTVTTTPSVTKAALQSLSWLPVVPPVTQKYRLDSRSPHLAQGDIQGPVAAFALPADQGALEITLSSLVKDNAVFVPNVLVLDEQLRPAAFYPSRYFPYQSVGVISSDRLEGQLKLTPALGQKQIYLLVYTTAEDLATTTTLLAPAKAYAQGVGNAVPDIPDPVARHSTTGELTLNVSSEQNSSNVVIGLFQSSSPAPVVVGPTATPPPATGTTVSASKAIPPSTDSSVVTGSSTVAKTRSEPLLSETDRYFNQAIKAAVNGGNIDKALKLLNEAERLGSATARDTFISSVKSKE